MVTTAGVRAVVEDVVGGFGEQLHRELRDMLGWQRIQGETPQEYRGRLLKNTGGDSSRIQGLSSTTPIIHEVKAIIHD